MRTQRHVIAILAVCLLAACRTTTDTSQLTDQGLKDLKALQVTKIVNDATNTVIAANHAGKLSDAIELQILGINKQVLDVIEAQPATFPEKAFTVIKNARDASPPNVQQLIDTYLAAVVSALQGGK